MSSQAVVCCARLSPFGVRKPNACDALAAVKSMRHVLWFFTGVAFVIGCIPGNCTRIDRDEVHRG